MIESISPFVINKTILLFIGGVDQVIHYYEKSIESNAEFEYKFSLKGHENAITKLIITSVSQEEFLLASASKDGYIRLWKITSDQSALKFHKNVHKLVNNYFIHLESVLTSHECSVTNLSWTRFGG